MSDTSLPGPVVDITERWNECQQAYYKRERHHYHGPLRGLKRRSSKECLLLIVEDSFQGKPVLETLDPKRWNGFPDFFDFKRVIAIPLDDYFRGRRRWVASVDRLIDLGSVWAEALNLWLATQSDTTP